MSSGAPVPAPRVALMNGSTVYTWSDGSNFNGFILIELIVPSDGSTPWGEVDYGNLYPSITLPTMQRIPIINGQANTSCGVFLTPDITPPNSSYIAWYYDSTGRKIAGPTVTFQVTSQSAFTPPILTLPIPTQIGPVVNPDSNV